MVTDWKDLQLDPEHIEELEYTLHSLTNAGAGIILDT